MSRPSAVLCIILSGLLAACAATKQARDVDQTGFLGDIYPKLRKGREGEALLVYKPDKIDTARFSKYTKILLDPVTVWRGEESREKGAPQKDIQVLADHFFSLLYLTFKQDYEMVQTPGPQTLRIQVAITKLQESMVVLDVVSTVVPQARALSTLKGLATGKPAFVGEASVEAKVSDAGTGRVLAAVVDRRVGGKKLEAEAFDSWGDVNEILEFWAKMARFRLCEARGAKDCILPEA